nr:AAA family ATPase [Dietzia sp. CW19]
MDTGQHVVDNALDRLVAAGLDRRALAELPPPQPLIEGLLFLDSVARLVGKPGSYKTYVALDFALCVLTGKPWHGRVTLAGGGKVLYLVGEGLAGINNRIAAWEAEYNDGKPVGYDADGDQTLMVLPVPMNLASTDPEVLALIQLIAGEQFDLVIVDTQARFTTGAEENSAADMGMLVKTLDTMRKASGACVTVVHHSGHTGTHGRGSTAVNGGLETELILARGDRGEITLHVDKQKNAKEIPDINLVMHEVRDNLVVRTLDEVGGAAGLDYMGHLQAPLEPRGRRDKSPNYEKLARFIWEVYQGGSGETKANISAALKSTTWGTEPDTQLRLTGAQSQFRKRFDESWTALEKRGWIATVGGRSRQMLTAAGVEELGYSDESDTAGEDAADD